MVEQNKKISVSEFLQIVKKTINETMPVVYLKAEIGQFTCASSGHWYFTLKDNAAQVKAVMFKMKSVRVGFLPKVGDEVEIAGVVTIYDQKGDLQIVCETLKKAGQGNLYEAFLQLKAKLQKEGLFAELAKKQLPKYVFSIGVITSAQAAAWADIQIALERRIPHVKVFLYPTAVQGAAAKNQLVRAIKQADQSDHDVLIVSRGGGSLEDLWAFNEEPVVRQIAASHTPVIVGVGHESDITLAEFAADLRAATPTAAAELCSAPTEQLQAEVQTLWLALTSHVNNHVQQMTQRVDMAELAVIQPESRLQAAQVHTDRMASELNLRFNKNLQILDDKVTNLHKQLKKNIQRGVEANQLHFKNTVKNLQGNAYRGFNLHEVQLKHMESLLNAISPQRNLEKGYAFLSDKNTGKLISSIQTVKSTKFLKATLADGAITVKVQENSSEDQSAF